MRLKQFVKKYIDPNLIVNVFVKVNNKYYKKVYSCLRAKNLLIDLEHDNYKNYSVLKIEEIKQSHHGDSHGFEQENTRGPQCHFMQSIRHGEGMVVFAFRFACHRY